MAETVARTADRLGSLPAVLTIGAPLAVAAFLVAEAVALPAAWLPLEEAATVLRARGLDELGGREVGPLYPLLLAPLERTLSAGAFYEVVRIAGALLWAAAFVPALAIARRCVEGVPAVIAAALAVVVPAAVYSTAVVPDAPAFLLAVSSLALAMRAIDGGRVATLAGGIALAVAAALVRPWLAVLPVVVAVAAAVARGSLRFFTRWPYSAGFALAAGALYAAYYAVGAPAPWDVARAGLAGAGAAAVGVGVVPWLVAWATVDRPEARPVALLLVVAAPALAVSAGVAAAAAGRGVEERPLVVLSPLVLGLAVRAWRMRELPPARIGAVAVVTAAALLLVPTSLDEPAANGAASLALAESVLGSTGAAVVVLAALVLAAAALLTRGPHLPVIAGVVGALVLVGHVAAWTEARAAADDGAAALAEPRDWIDRAVPDGERATLVSAAPAGDGQAAQSLIWNRSLRGTMSVDPARADPATGALGRAPTPLAVAAPGLELAGEELAAGPSGRLLRVGATLRLAFAIEGLYPDGWSSGDAFYRRFAGGDAPGTVEVVVSRKAWTGPDKPAQVVIVSRPLEGEAFAERITDIHSAQERVVPIPVPAPPFEIKVAVGPTFSPSEYGQPDTRQLGAQLTFAYRPGP
jgi:hypothetical protein